MSVVVATHVSDVDAESVLVAGVQNPQASAQCSVTKFLRLELSKSKQAPLCTSVLQVTSSVLLPQFAGLVKFVEFSKYVHNSTH